MTSHAKRQIIGPSLAISIICEVIFSLSVLPWNNDLSPAICRESNSYLKGKRNFFMFNETSTGCVAGYLVCTETDPFKRLIWTKMPITSRLCQKCFCDGRHSLFVCLPTLHLFSEGKNDFESSLFVIGRWLIDCFQGSVVYFLFRKCILLH